MFFTEHLRNNSIFGEFYMKVRKGLNFITTEVPINTVIPTLFSNFTYMYIHTTIKSEKIRKSMWNHQTGYPKGPPLKVINFLHRKAPKIFLRSFYADTILIGFVTRFTWFLNPEQIQCNNKKRKKNSSYEWVVSRDKSPWAKRTQVYSLPQTIKIWSSLKDLN